MTSVAAQKPAPQELPTNLHQRGLTGGHFRKIATNGFGDGGNAYSWGCTWYKDHLYIGTNRLVLVIYKKRIRYNINTAAWPVGINQEHEPLDMRGQVWRYSLEENSWERVFHSPMTEGVDGKSVPLACGFRHLTQFQGKSDPHPVIYSIPGAGFDSLGPTLLRCEDGVNFEPASKPGLGLDPKIVAYRGAVSFKGRLFISPAGYRGGHVNIAYGAPVFCSDDPRGGNWAASNTPGFGDPSNHGIFDIGVCGDYLYAGTINIRYGAQLWKTDGEGPPPHRWTKVFDAGADRGPFNQGIYCFAAHRGCLYLGTAVQNGGNDRENNIGPAAGEVIRVHPDDTWDLVVGEPRMTRHGLRLPTSGLGAGFDNPFNGYIWRMCSHDGALYVGTLDSFGFFSFADPAEWPLHVRRLLDTQLLENILERRGGCELWRSIDGDNWQPITTNGFGNPFNWGVRAMVSTPKGLFVGTANPFGPQVATRGIDGWRYEQNSRGGLEVWHGSFANEGCGDMDAGATGLPEMNFLLQNISPRVSTGITAPNMTPPTAGNPFLAGPPKHNLKSFEAPAEEDWQSNPLFLQSQPEKDLQGLGETAADEIRNYFGGTLQNVGYWSKKNSSPRQASEQLLTEMLRFLSPQNDGVPRRILVLDPQAGEIQSVLQRLLPGAQIDVFSDPKSQAETEYETAISVAGFTTNFERDLATVARRLAPGGRFITVVLAGCPVVELVQHPITPDQYLEALASQITAARLQLTRSVDITDKSWQSFCRHTRAYFATKRLFNQIDDARHHEILSKLPGGRNAIAACCALVIDKPRE